MAGFEAAGEAEAKGCVADVQSPVGCVTCVRVGLAGTHSRCHNRATTKVRAADQTTSVTGSSRSSGANAVNLQQFKFRWAWGASQSLAPASVHETERACLSVDDYGTL